jgi:hypothetical protein
MTVHDEGGRAGQPHVVTQCWSVNDRLCVHNLIITVSQLVMTTVAAAHRHVKPCTGLHMFMHAIVPQHTALAAADASGSTPRR